MATTGPSTTWNFGRVYWLVETKAPAGHSLLPRPITFTLDAAQTDGTGTKVELGDEVENTAKWAKGAVQAFSSISGSLPGPKGFLVGNARKATLLVKDTEVGHLPRIGAAFGIYPVHRRRSGAYGRGDGDLAGHHETASEGR